MGTSKNARCQTSSTSRWRSMSLKLHQPGLHRKIRHQAKRKHRAQMLPSTKGKAATRNRAQLTHPGHQEGFRSAKPQPPPKQHGKGLLPQRRQHGAAGQPFHDSCGSEPKFLAAAQQREPQARPVPAQQLHGLCTLRPGPPHGPKHRSSQPQVGHR